NDKPPFPRVVERPDQRSSSGRLGHREGLVRRHVLQSLNDAAGPVQLYLLGAVRRAQAEAGDMLAFRAVARSAPDPARLRPTGSSQHDPRPDPLAVAPDAPQAQRQPMVPISALVAE